MENIFLLLGERLNKFNVLDNLWDLEGKEIAEYRKQE